MMEPVYTAVVTSSGDGRDGRIRSTDGYLDLELKLPPALGGPGGASDPEQLFAAAYAGCFHSAVRLVARTEKVTLPEGTTVEATVGIGPDGGGFGINAVLTVHLPGMAQDQADEIVAAAHQVCPYSKATRGNIDVTLVATV